MDAKRMGEIALKIVEKKIKDDGLRIKEISRRAITQEANDLGISADEFAEFVEIVYRKFFETAFSKMKEVK